MNTERNPFLVEKDGLLVFTGSIDEPDVDWVARVRAEREEDILRSLGIHFESQDPSATRGTQSPDRSVNPSETK